MNYFSVIKHWKSLTDPTLSRRDEELTLCNRARHCSSTCHIALAQASTLWKFRRQLTVASQGKPRAGRLPPAIRLSSLLHFGGFSLTVLPLLQIHFLQKKTQSALNWWKTEKEINLQCKFYSFVHVKKQWIEYLLFGSFLFIARHPLQNMKLRIKCINK